VRIELHRDDPRGDARELRGQPAAARAEIEHKVARTNFGVANELRGQRLRTEEMLTTCAARPSRRSCAALGHGPSP
jgi:hypothetical protein